MLESESLAAKLEAEDDRNRTADRRAVESGVSWSEVNRRNCIGGSVAHLYRPRFDFDSGKNLSH
jgi:hypothetical protein